MRTTSLAALACLLLLAAPGAHAAFPGLNGKIAFDSTHGAPCNGGPCNLTYDVFVVNPDGSGLARLTTTNGAVTSWDPTWTADGTELHFRRAGGGTHEIHVMASDGTGQMLLGPDPSSGNLASLAWAPDGERFAFSKTDFDGNPGFNTDIYTWNLQTQSETNLTANPGGDERPAWSAHGNRIAFTSGRAGKVDVWTMTDTGTGLANITSSRPSGNSFAEWSPDGTRIAFINQHLYVMNADGSGVTLLFSTSPSAQPLSVPAWSPDGSMIAFRTGAAEGSNAIRLISLASGQVTTVFQGEAILNLDWQPLRIPARHVRPKSAPSVKVSLVPAFVACASPNRQHGPPLAFPSCNPPAPASTAITTAAPAGSDNANLVGSMVLKAKAGTPGPPDDSDMIVQGSVSDVRCLPGTQACGNPNSPGGADYIGDLRAETTVRLTDRFNGTEPGGGSQSATSTDFPFYVVFACANSASTTQGALCPIPTTSFNALAPGAVKDGKRAVMELGQVTVFDGGPDGDADSVPNTPFLRQGLFVP